MKKVLIIAGMLKIGGAEKVARDIGYYADKEKYEILKYAIAIHIMDKY